MMIIKIKIGLTTGTQVDVDGSGFLEFPEFCLMMYKKLSDTDVVKKRCRNGEYDDTGN